jgi:hypothetical protein
MSRRLCAVAAALTCALARADPPPTPPPGYTHLVLAPGQTLRLKEGGSAVSEVDAQEPDAGGLYVAPPLARYDLERVRWLEAYARAAREEAEAKRSGARFELVAVTGVIGVGIGVVVGVAIAHAAR